MHNNGKVDHNDVDGKPIEQQTAYLITLLIMSKHGKPTQFFVLLKNCNLIWNGLWQIIFLCSERTLKIGNFDSIFPRRLITSNDLESLNCSIISMTIGHFWLQLLYSVCLDATVNHTFRHCGNSQEIYLSNFVFVSLNHPIVHLFRSA